MSETQVVDPWLGQWCENFSPKQIRVLFCWFSVEFFFLLCITCSGDVIVERLGCVHAFHQDMSELISTAQADYQPIHLKWSLHGAHFDPVTSPSRWTSKSELWHIWSMCSLIFFMILFFAIGFGKGFDAVVESGLVCLSATGKDKSAQWV